MNSFFFGNAAPPSGSYNLEFDFEPIEVKSKKKKCECGAAKVKTTHSDWCPLYQKWKK